MPTKQPPKLATKGEVTHKVRLDRDGYVRCRVCSCTEREPCDPPCSWAEEDLCSLCASAVDALFHWESGAHRPSWAALRRDVARLLGGMR